MVKDLEVTEHVQSEGDLGVKGVSYHLLNHGPVPRLEGGVTQVSDDGELGGREEGGKKGGREGKRLIYTYQ